PRQKWQCLKHVFRRSVRVWCARFTFGRRIPRHPLTNRNEVASSLVSSNEADEVRQTEMATKANWTDERTELLIELLTVEIARGKGTDAGGLKKEAYTRLVAAFNAKAKTKYAKKQLQGRLSTLKAEYMRVHALRTSSGFGWDAVSGLPTAPDEVWTAYLANNPKSAPFRVKPFPLYDQLHAIYSGAVATGEFATARIAASVDSDGEESIADASIADASTADASETEPESEHDADDLLDEPRVSRAATPTRPRPAYDIDEMEPPDKRRRRGNAIADSLMYLAETQKGLQEGRFVKQPKATEDAVKLFRSMKLPLSARQRLDFVRYLTMTALANDLFLNLDKASRLELVAQICSIDVADLQAATGTHE
ncbi:hypothetical protein ACHHYP_11216, partial [Achlya hypogyna]